MDNVFFPVESLAFSQMELLVSVLCILSLTNTCNTNKNHLSFQSNGKDFQITVILYNYILSKMMWEKINFKENMKNLSFKSVELGHWKAIYVELLHCMLGKRSEIEVKSPKEVIIETVVGVYNCQHYRTHKSCWFNILSSEAVTCACY